MIQFNLLPDVKLEYVKARRSKYLMTFIAFIVGAVALTVFLFSLFIVNVVQKKSLSDLNRDISKYSTQLKNTKDLSKILTVQNQLSTLTSLHNGKPVTSRIFDYVTKLTPDKVGLNRLSIDYEKSVITVSGSAPDLDTVSVYTDTLKATKYVVQGEDGTKKAFSNVVLTSFSRDDKGASFTITYTFDPVLFDATKTVQVVVPNITTSDQTNVFDTENK